MRLASADDVPAFGEERGSERLAAKTRNAVDSVITDRHAAALPSRRAASPFCGHCRPLLVMYWSADMARRSTLVAVADADPTAQPTDYLKGTVTGPGTLENTAMKSRSSGVR